ncbi:unnamed protein product, partial [Mesorhabditis belari]|uniref:Uncharacterized protein n=1 Tax=Mesorhabditis belari TaxID=2138241 RepID=A0AAF3J7B9_9BILA
MNELVAESLSCRSVKRCTWYFHTGATYLGNQYHLGESLYENPLYRQDGYHRSGYEYPYNQGSSHWYMSGPRHYGAPPYYGRSSSHDNMGYNPLLYGGAYPPGEASSYLSMIHDKENFQPQGCGWDGVQQRCTDGLGICRGGCRDFSNAYSALRDCRCIPYGYSALMRLVGGFKKTKKV